MTKRISVLMLLAWSASMAQTDEDTLALDGYMLGVKIHSLNVDDFVIAEVPMIEARVPIGDEGVQFMYGGGVLWGVSEFFAEWYYSSGLLYYPLEGPVGIAASARLGTALLDNMSYAGSLGVNMDIWLGPDHLMSVEIEYFYRNSSDLIDYISFPVHAGTGEEAINIGSEGIGVGVGFRF